MKKLIVGLIVSAMLGSVAVAQNLNRGNFMIGATMGLSTANSTVEQGGVESKGLSARLVQIAPSMGYFIFDNVAVGIGADFTIDRVTDVELGGTRDNSNLLFGPFGRYYFPLKDNVAVFGVANFGFGNSTSEKTIAGQLEGIRNNIFAFGMGPGLMVYTRGGFSLEAIIKYNHARSRFETSAAGGKVTTITRTNQVGLSLGVQYYFGGFRGVGG
jgi:hypothetical protein